MTNRWKIIVEYDGRFFHGWQSQLGFISVAETIEQAIYRLSGEKLVLMAAGRTDAGVHARAQVAHFDLEKPIDGDKLRLALNAHLREIANNDMPVAIIDAVQVDDEFHARFSATYRRYLYRILNRKSPPVLDRGRVWHVIYDLDIPLMEKAASLLVGHHDFTSFRASHCQSKSPIKTLDILEITKAGEELHIHAKARSFLHHQVRNLVGTLVEVGRHRIAIDDIPAIFDARDRTKAGPTAPAEGLYFMEVGY